MMIGRAPSGPRRYTYARATFDSVWASAMLLGNVNSS